jgi:transposase InsO family protein
MRKNIQNYFPNLVHHEFVVSQPNTHWFADSSEIDFKNNKGKIYCLLLIDGCFNEIIQWSIASVKLINATDTVRRFKTAIRQRKIPISEVNREPQLIIHTDRGSQFSGEVYFQFTQKFQNQFQASMSSMNNPTENGVAERFMRTFKSFRISEKELNSNKKTIVEVFEEKFKNKEINMIFVKEIMAKFVQVYNSDKKTKKAKEGANKNQLIFEEGKEFLKKPKYMQAYSEHAMKIDPRRTEIEIYKNK